MSRLRTIPYAVLTVGLLAAGGASAQSMSSFDQREAAQQDRIDAGRRDGSLTRSEAYRLEQGEQRINRYEARARADGVVTPGERQRLDGMLDREGHQINRERNDGQRADGRDNGNHGWDRGNHNGWNQSDAGRNGWNHNPQSNNGRNDGDRSWSHSGQPPASGATSPAHTGWNGNGQGTGQTNGQTNGQNNGQNNGQRSWTHQPNPSTPAAPTTTASGQGNAWTHGTTHTASAPQAASYTRGTPARVMATSAPAATAAAPARTARSTGWTNRH